MTWKRKLAWGFGTIAVLIALAAAWMLGPALLPARHIEAGIAMGAKAPVGMPLLDSKGQPANLVQAMGEKGMVLLLVRSAGWCPFCKAQLARTGEIRAPLAKLGYSIASISYDQPQVLEEFATEQAIGFAMFSDPGSKLIDALGLRDPQYGKDSFAYGVPRASVLVLAPDGTVKAKFVDEDYRSRQSNDQVLEMVRNAN